MVYTTCIHIIQACNVASLALNIQRGYGREGMVGGSKLSTFENNMYAEVHKIIYVLFDNTITLKRKSLFTIIEGVK